MEINFDLSVPENSYIFGFLQADGHLSSHKKAGLKKGKLTVELAKIDKDILLAIQKIIPVSSSLSSRIRNTNYKDEYESESLRIHVTEFRELLNSYGLLVGKKSNNIKIPAVKFSEIDYWRGIIDGDGSLGFTETNFPFISLTTTSDFIADSYKEFIFKTTNKINGASRNTRDNAYNIIMYKENAQKIIEKLYYNGCLSLNRKLILANKILNWERPYNMKKRSAIKFWTKEQDDFIINNDIHSSMNVLCRSKKSIETRLWRLKKK